MKIWKNWLFREAVSILFKLHPVLLMSLGLLDSNETFLVLVLSYFMMAVFSQLKATYTFGYYCIAIEFPKHPSIAAKTLQAFFYLIGWLFMLLFTSFIYLIFFGLMYDSVERQDYPATIFDGASGAILARTLLINAGYFFLVELVRFVKEIRTYSAKEHPLMTTFSFGIDLQVRNKWRTFHIVWLMVFFAFFILMCTGFAFKTAIYSFFVFDIGYLFLRRLDDRKNNRPDSYP